MTHDTYLICIAEDNGVRYQDQAQKPAEEDLSISRTAAPFRVHKRATTEHNAAQNDYHHNAYPHSL